MRQRRFEIPIRLEHEDTVRAMPALRAERIVKSWSDLEAEHKTLWSERHRPERERVEKELEALTREIKTDPRLQGLVEDRHRDLGPERERLRLGEVLRERSLERAIGLSLGRGIDRDYDLSL